MRICVYCASSEQCARVYHNAAAALGQTLAENGCTVVYGGGAVGLMGSLANAALAAGGNVVGAAIRHSPVTSAPVPNPSDVAGTQQKLEDAAAAAYTS